MRDEAEGMWDVGWQWGIKDLLWRSSDGPTHISTHISLAKLPGTSLSRRGGPLATASILNPSSHLGVGGGEGEGLLQHRDGAADGLIRQTKVLGQCVQQV